MIECIQKWIEVIYKFFLIIGIIAGAGTYYWRVYKRKKQEDLLFQLGKLRTEAVVIRNQGNVPLNGEELKKWIEEAKNINKKIISKAKEFDPVLGGFLETLDKLPREINKNYDANQLRLRDTLSERLKRVKDMIDKYYAPKSYS